MTSQPMPNRVEWTLQHAFDRTAAVIWRQKKSGTILTRNGEQVVQWLGPGTLVKNITTEMIDEMIEGLVEDGLANGTINRKLAALSCILALALEYRKIASKPKIRTREESESRIRFLTDAEEAAMIRLLRQWGKQDHAEAVAVLVDTGLRPSELWRLHARDCEGKALHIWQTKNGHPRSVPMTTRVECILRARATVAPGGVLFPYSNKWLQQVWDKARCQLGHVEDTQFVPYALRHTCASRLIQRGSYKGVTLKHVQEWLGHRSIATTMRYAHLSPTSLLDAVGVLEPE